MNERFAAVDDRIDRLANHVDGFMKLHETLDIELKVMKEQMSRFEQRLDRLEAAQAS
jgi:chaperonin cofactor prefoldin